MAGDEALEALYNLFQIGALQKAGVACEPISLSSQSKGEAFRQERGPFCTRIQRTVFFSP